MKQIAVLMTMIACARRPPSRMAGMPAWNNRRVAPASRSTATWASQIRTPAKGTAFGARGTLGLANSALRRALRVGNRKVPVRARRP